VRVGIIGAGFGARVVAPVFAALPNCTVVDVISPRDERGVTALCNRTDLDLVSVHSPPFLHAPHARAALDGGHAVLCDKPFALSAAEAAELVDHAAAAGAVNLVNFEFRCDPVREELHRLLRDGAIGTPEHASWTHLSSGSRVPLRRHGWLFEAASGGGWIGAWGSHAVDALRWLLGEVESVSAERTLAVPERPDAAGTLRACDAEDGFTARLGLTGGVTVAIDSTFAATATVAPRLVITGSEGVLECVADTTITLRRADGTRDRFTAPPADGDPHLVPMRRWAEQVRRAVDDGELVGPTFADGAACDAVLDQLRAAPLRASSVRRAQPHE
jgi:predicted dehydrogenase